MISVVIYLTHDNTFALEVSSGGSPIDLVATGVTRVVVTSATETVDSAINPEAFDYATDGASGIIEFDFADIITDLGHHLCSLTIFDPLHPDGQVWGDAFTMLVKQREVI